MKFGKITNLSKSLRNTLKLATCTTGSFCTTKRKAVSNSVSGFIRNIRAGEKLAKECEQVATMLKEATDKVELLEAANSLRTQADAIETIARSM